MPHCGSSSIKNSVWARNRSTSPCSNNAHTDLFATWQALATQEMISEMTQVAYLNGNKIKS